MKGAETHNMYYVAILCPQEIDEKIEGYKHWMKDRYGCVAALKSPAHITLIPPFWLEDKREPELQQALQTFTSNIPKPEIRVKGFSHFNRTVLYAEVDQNMTIDQLKRAVETHFISLFPGVIKKDDRPFHPHITIATRDLKPADFVKAWEHFSTMNFAATFITSNISLLKLSSGRWNEIAHILV
jgi:2'-5' RNA ligase